MNILEFLTIISFLILIYMSVVFLISIKIEDASIVDIAWGIGFIIITLTSLIYFRNFGHKQVLVSMLVLFWAVRLSTHIFFRNKDRGEDWRYKKWREQWGGSYLLRAHFQIFILQGLLMIMISLPVIYINSSNFSAVTIIDLIGVIIWNIGFYFESIADYQLLKFKSSGKSKDNIFTEGLWKYSRHPNYFGEILIWWGIFILTLQMGLGLIPLLSPLLITFLLVRVSGVPMLENKYKNNKEYQRYKKNTPALIPYKLFTKGEIL